jgi:hypothetical protein
MTRALIVLAALGLITVGGCVKMHSETVIENDGSGSATMHFSMPKDVAQAMQEIGDMPGAQMDDAPPSPSQVTEAKVKEIASKYDVKVKTFKKIDSDEREGFEMELEFDRVDDVSYVLAGIMGGGDDGMGIYSTGDGNYRLASVKLDLPEASDEEAAAEATAESESTEMNDEEMQKSMELMQTMMGHMAELDVLMKITVPGDVIESNAPQVEGRTSIWKIDSTNMMNAQNDMEPSILFSGKGVKIKAPQQAE